MKSGTAPNIFLPSVSCADGAIHVHLIHRLLSVMLRVQMLPKEREISHHLGLSPARRNSSIDHVLSSNESRRIACKKQSNVRNVVRFGDAA